MTTPEEQPQTEYEQFLASPVGQARLAFEHGDRVFQCSHAVHSQAAILMALSRSAPPSRTTDPNEVLNWVCNEGWELVNGSFVFVEQAHQSRNKMVTTGRASQ